VAVSSIHFVKAHAGGLEHNDRTQKNIPEYLLPEEHRLENLIDTSAKDGEQKIRDLYQAAKNNYKKTFRQSLQAKSYLWEAVVNLNEHHTLEDVQKLAKELEHELGFTTIQCAIHRDEGHINERNVPIRNLHAHITFFTLDQNTGQSLYRKSISKSEKEKIKKELGLGTNKKLPSSYCGVMDKAKMSKLQDITAQCLNMQRGKQGSQAIRLEHKQQRVIAKEREKALATEQKLKEEIAKIRAEYKSAGAIRADYAQLEQLNKDLKEKIKNKELTIDELRTALKATTLYKEMKDTSTDEIINSSPHPVLNMEKETVETKDGEIKEFYTNESVQILMQKYTKLEMKAITQVEVIDVLEKEISRLSNFINKLKSFFNLENLLDIYRKIVKGCTPKPTLQEMEHAAQLKKEVDVFFEKSLGVDLSENKPSDPIEKSTVSESISDMKKGLAERMAKRAERKGQKEESKAPDSKDDDKKEQRFGVRKR